MTESQDLQDLRAQTIADGEIPPKIREFLAKGASLEEIRLDEFGKWFHEGEAFVHEGLSRLFHRSLRRTSAGTWTLVIEPYTYPVIVEKTGRFIRRLYTSDGALSGEDILEQRIEIRPDSLFTDGQTFIASDLGGGQLARFIESAHHDLLELIDVSADGAWILDYQSERWPISLLSE